MRWQTPDPLGFEDGLNIYAFVRNNSFRYYDPDGQFAILIPLVCIAYGGGSIAISGTTLGAIAGAITGALLGVAVYNVDKWFDTNCDKNDDENEEEDKNNQGYAPDRPLPLDGNGVHIPDTDAPHTQLGTRNGRRRYRQAREFDKDGKPVRDIDFTDHNYPHLHPNPHQHRWEENQTGGSLQRGDPEPLPG